MTIPKLPPRDPQSHKGDFGRVLLIGGSRGMSGAIALAGMAALRSGSGLVRLAVPACVQSEVAAAEPSLMTAALPCDDDGRILAAAREPIAELAAAADVVALGPGLGRSVALDTLVAWAFTHLERPLLVDADGLNALAEARHLFRPAPAARILTPHPGELERLTGVSASSGRQDQSAAADQLAAQIAGVVVLKGHGTYVTDGTRQAVNETGNPGLATGGAGDVLTGVIAALWGQAMTAWDAARLGVHVHGLAGDLAAAQLGQVSLIASDLVRFLPEAFRTIA